LKNRRLIGFFFAIVLGLAAGLFYGWLVNPGQPRDTSLGDLRADYQADYVLMVAEAYPQQADIAGAVELLRKVDAQDPLGVVRKGLQTAQQLGYSQQDIQTIAALEMRLSAWAGAQ
jgi:hypothetical protein